MMRLRALTLVASTVLLATALSGCRHKPVVAAPAPPIPAPTPVAIEKPKEPQPNVVAKVPIQPAPLPEITVKRPKRLKRRKDPAPVLTARVPAPVAPPASSMASAAPPPTLGSLSAGGEGSPGKAEQAKGMISDLERRLKGLEARVQKQQREGIVRVRYFEREANQALNMGDADGAVTLVTKAKLLLDDLVK